MGGLKLTTRTAFFCNTVTQYCDNLNPMLEESNSYGAKLTIDDRL